MELSFLGKGIIIFGLFLICLGVFLTLVGKIPFLGRLPGDILIKKENFTFYFPLITCLLLSIILTIILNFILRR